MAAPTLVSAASLPRFVALQTGSEVGDYLTVQLQSGVPYLTFTAQQKTRLAAHEVVFNVDEEGVVMMRAPNGRFWQRNSAGYIVADRESIPSNRLSHPACYFKVFRRTDGRLLLQSLLDDRYIKRYTTGNIYHALHASATGSEDIFAALHLTSAVDAAVVLPRYLMFYGDNQRYVGDHRERDIDWLNFNKETPRLAATQEVIPLLDGNVMIRNVNLQKFWRRSPNWIWADVATLSTAENNKDCHFDVLKLSSTLVALRSIANDRLLRRYTDYWEDMLCAIGTSINDSTARLLLREAVLSRTLFNIKYLLALAEVSEITPVLVGSGSMLNDTEFATDLEVQVTLTQEVTNSQTWSTSTTFSTSLTVGFSVGIPEVASVNGSITIGQERTISTEMGNTSTSALQFQTTFKVPGVPPRTEVKVTVECTTAKCRIPFTYTSKDTRIDGIDMPTVDNVDGIFEGVNAFNIRGVVTTVASDSHTKVRENMVLPVSFTSAS